MKTIKSIRIIFIITAMLFSLSIKAQSDFNDVAQIFYTRCTSCHHDGGVTFPLMTYDDVAGNIGNIQYDLQTDHMPPWPPDTAYTTSGYAPQRYLHETIITFAEKTAILQWITDGGLKGDSTLVPTPTVYADTRFKLNGTPTLKLQIPTFANNAVSSTEDAYNCFSLPTGLTSDRWLQAFEIVAGDPEIVHHVVLTIDTLGTSQTDTSGTCFVQAGEIFIGRWTPGVAPMVYPNGSSLKAGLRIPAGSNVVLKINYAAGAAGVIDSTCIRMFFYPQNETGIRPIHSDVFLQYKGNAGGGGTFITANTVKTFTVTPANQLIPHAQPPAHDISLFGVDAHSNEICTALKNYAYSGTDTIPIIRVNKWYNEWEGYFYLPNLVKIPNGYTFKAEHVMDNTTNNPHQPNASPVNIYFGNNPDDEMIYDSFQWMDFQAGDELIDMRSIIEQDTLFTVGIKDFVKPLGIQSFIYPNPVSDKLNVYLSQRSDYSGRIYNITGQTVLVLENFKENLTVDIKNIPVGLYIVEITDIRTKEIISKKVVISH
jgi:Secretion system C-terminal sorting domain